MVMPRIDRRDNRLRRVLGHDGRGIGGQRGQPDHRLVGGERNAARGGKADAQPGETAGAGGDGDSVERSEANAGRLHDARDQRHQGFGMAALHRLRFLRDQFARVGVEHGGSTGVERGIDGEDQHGSSLIILQRN